MEKDNKEVPKDIILESIREQLEKSLKIYQRFTIEIQVIKMEKYSYLLQLPKQLAISIIQKLPTEEVREALKELEEEKEK